jgi:hypothetical protein
MRSRTTISPKSSNRALTVLLKDVAKTKVAATEHPRRSDSAIPGSRHIPADVRRAVWARDAAQCAFVGTNGRCTETGFLEFHHVVPYAAGGAATVENVQIRCAAHNRHEADLFFGPGDASLVRESAALAYGLSVRSVRSVRKEDQSTGEAMCVSSDVAVTSRARPLACSGGHQDIVLRPSKDLVKPAGGSAPTCWTDDLNAGQVIRGVTVRDPFVSDDGSREAGDV